MRPISVNIQNQTQLYNEQSKLSQIVRVNPDDVSYETPSSKKRRTGQVVAEVPVATVLETLEALLISDWDPQAKWDTTDNSEALWKRLVNNAGSGYEDATADLINQVGTYCVFCDTPLLSGLNATPVKPLAWSPQTAFSFNNLLLVCPACNAARSVRIDNNTLRSDKPRRNDTTVYALPTTYWKGLADHSLLPIEYKLVKENVFGLTSTPVPPELINTTLALAYQLGFIQVDRASLADRGKVVVDLVDLVSIHRRRDAVPFPKFDDLYQLEDLANLLDFQTLKGLLADLGQSIDTMNTQFKNFVLADIGEEEYTLDRLHLHFRLSATPATTNVLTKLLAVLQELKAIRIIKLAVHITAPSVLPTANAITATINLFGLNGTFNFLSSFLDRRMELRTLAFFKAIVMRDLYAAAREGEPQLQPIMLEQLKQAIAATGFWGIWFNIFGQSILSTLSEVMPGTVATKWQG